MKVTVFASLVASAAAFAPSLKGSSSPPSVTSLSGAMDSMDGSIDFRGQEFKFDPLKLSETFEPWLPWFRESEIRHGRTAMLAVVGFVVQDFVRLPGDMYSFEHVPKVNDAHDLMIADGPLTQLLLWLGLWELIVTGPACSAMMAGEREPGDYGWTWFAPKDAAGLKKKKDSELLNGRLAMVAVGGIATQSVLTGHGFPYI